jgi:hypothetical protein
VTISHRGIDVQLRISPERGSMARLLEAVDAAGVELLGFFGVEVGGGLDEDHFLVEDADAMVAAASRAGAEEVGRREVLVAAARTQRAVADVLRRLADNGVSIDMIYTRFDGDVVIGIDGDDLDRAVAAVDRQP